MTSSIRFPRALRASALALALAAGPAMAATIQEPSVAGGDFSSNWTTPTTIDFGYDLVTGTTGASDYDYLVFTSLTPGAQTVTLSFSLPASASLAGGTVQYSTAPMTSATDGSALGGFFLTDYAPGQSLTLSLGSSFAGTLYLGITTLIGDGISYTISAAGNAPPAPVPLPASAALLGGLLVGGGAFGAARRSKRRSA